jgi:hypothetical protein
MIPELIVFGLFVTWIIVNKDKLRKDDVWKSLLVAIPVELALYEGFVGNAIWRYGDGSYTFRPSAIFTILLAPFKIFGETGFTRYFLWSLPFAYQNIFYVWAIAFVGLTYLRK